MKAMILNVGNEVLLGKTINTNASFLSLQLERIGISVHKITVVGDDAEAISSEVTSFLDSDIDILITTGGLGPTHDDFTKEVICSTLHIKLTYNRHAAKDMYNYFGVEKNDCNRKQTYFPENCLILPNKLGSADGMILAHEHKYFILLVGPPYELEPMFLDSVVPFLKDKGKPTKSRDFIVMGNSESFFESFLEHLLNQYGNHIAPYASNGIIRYRITCDDEESNFDDIVVAFKNKMQPYIIGEDNDTIESVLVQRCLRDKLTLSFAESCTGGILSSMITSIPNASCVLKESFVTYSDEAKQTYLDVQSELIDTFDSVSKEVVIAMANGLYHKTKRDICIAVSGYAGPTGKDIGKVFFAILFDGHIHVEEARFRGNREMIRLRAARYILYKTYRLLNENV